VKKMKKIIAFMLVLIMLSGVVPAKLTAASAFERKTREYANVVVFVQFEPLSEKNFVEDKAAEIFKLWDDISYGTSLSSYLNTISYGRFQVHNIFPKYDGDSFTPYVIPAASAGDEYSLVDYVIHQIQTSENLDYDGDGVVDNLVIVSDKPYTDDRGDPFYSHKANYDGSSTIGGNAVFTYNMLNGYTVFDDILSQEGVICHEFLHSLGFPDLYRNSTADDSPVGIWDLMASSSIYLQYPLAYLRHSVAGWTQIDTITESAKGLTLDSQANPDGTHAYILRSPLSSNEFFVVEYRNKPEYDFKHKTLDLKIPGSGLIVYRINTKVAALSNYSSDSDGVYIFRPGVTDERYCTKDLSQSFLSGDPDIGRTTFGSTDFSRTTADNTPENTIISFSDGTNSGIQIKNVSAGDKESITFDVEFGSTEELNLWDSLGLETHTENSRQVSFAVDEGEGVYAVTDDGEIPSSSLFLTYWDGNQWTEAAPEITGASPGSERLLLYQNQPCVLYTSESGGKSSLFIATQKDGIWEEKKLASDVYYREYEAASVNDSIYIAYTDTVKNPAELKLIRYQPDTGELTADSYGEKYNASLKTFGDSVYLAARSFPENQISVYRITDSGDSEVLSSPDVKASIFSVCGGPNGAVYLCADITEGDSRKVQAYQFADGMWSPVGNSLGDALITDCEITASQEQLYLSYMEMTDSNSCKLSVSALENGDWVPLGDTVDRSVSQESSGGMEAGVSGSTFYIAYANAPNVYIKCKKLSGNSGSGEPVPEENPVVAITCIPPDSREYTIGEALNTKGMTVNAVRADDTAVPLEESQYQISGYDSSVPGEKKIKITYSEQIYCCFTVLVSEPPKPPAPQNSWKQDQTGWRYVYADGSYPVSRWASIDSKWYYFDAKGYRVTGWVKLGNTWYYLRDNGVMAVGWLKLGSTWYYLKDSGAMAVGWLKSGNTWYYLNGSGAMATGWLKLGSTWYYLNNSGAMATGWLKSGNTWYYLNGSGAMVTGWLKSGNTWYYLKSSGVMATGWLKLGNTWYYLKSSGAMATGWVKLGNTWYYLKSSGVMATGWLTIQGKRYHFNTAGAWIK
jgi:M6 family metalloprotease-like protein